MTTDDPYGPPLTDPAADRRTRLLPHPDAIRQAQAMLAAEPAADTALIPMFLPGKDQSWWTSGQPVHTVHGVVLLSQTGPTPTGNVPEHSWARDLAATIAALQLHAWATDHPEIRNREGEPGIAGWATVHRDGFVAVSEDILSPTQLLSLPSEASSPSS